MLLQADLNVEGEDIMTYKKKNITQVRSRRKEGNINH